MDWEVEGGGGVGSLCNEVVSSLLFVLQKQTDGPEVCFKRISISNNKTQQPVSISF